MLRWLLRLGFVGIVVAAAVWIWSQMNQDLDEDELDEEIPIEFEVPLDPDATVSLSSADAGDSGVGPGADFEHEPSATSEVPGADVSAAASGDDVQSSATSDMAVADDDAATSVLPSSDKTVEQTADDAHDLQHINGIGPVFERKLIQAGINNIAQLATTEPEALHALDLGFGADPEDWVKQAQEMTSAAK